MPSMMYAVLGTLTLFLNPRSPKTALVVFFGCEILHCIYCIKQYSSATFWRISNSHVLYVPGTVAPSVVSQPPLCDMCSRARLSFLYLSVRSSTILKFVATCACAQSLPNCLKSCVECLGSLVLRFFGVLSIIWLVTGIFLSVRLIAIRPKRMSSSLLGTIPSGVGK